MANGSAVDVSRIIDEQSVSWFNVQFVIWGFFLVLFDGYDIGAAAFAAPSLIREWHIASRAELGPVLSASLVGILIGSPLFGYVGDRFGRRIAIVGSCLTFGVFTWVAVLATGLDQLIVLRFLAGIGIGGLLPNIIALTAEFAPRRMRATLVIVMFTGITFGGSVPGAVAAWLVPQHGWQILFFIGGVAPVAVAIAALFALPESVKFLVLKTNRSEAIARLVRAMKPGLALSADTVFTMPDEKQYGRFSPKLLFGEGLAAVTPLLWVCFITNLMGFYFVMSWMPTLLGGANLPASQAALTTSLWQIGGTAGGIALSRFIDTRGFSAVTVLFFLAIPAVASIGYVATQAQGALLAIVFFGGFCVLGLQFGLNAASAMIYPTAYRSNGSGWAFGVGRFGSITGPLIGGFLIARHTPLPQLYAWGALPFVVGAFASLALAIIYRARFSGGVLGARALERPAASSKLATDRNAGI